MNHNRAYWRSQGLCVDCGGEVDDLSKYIRCKKCRIEKAKNIENTNMFCEVCGKEIDYPKYYRKCRKCRGENEIEKSTIVEKPYHVVKKLTREQMQAKFDKCLHCVWGNPIDGTVVCAFPHCANK